MFFRKKCKVEGWMVSFIYCTKKLFLGEQFFVAETSLVFNRYVISLNTESEVANQKNHFLRTQRARWKTIRSPSGCILEKSRCYSQKLIDMISMLEWITFFFQISIKFEIPLDSVKKIPISVTRRFIVYYKSWFIAAEVIFCLKCPRTITI